MIYDQEALDAHMPDKYGARTASNDSDPQIRTSTPSERTTGQPRGPGYQSGHLPDPLKPFRDRFEAALESIIGCSHD